MRQRAAASDVVIVNHHLLCADAAVRQSAYGEVIPECAYAVIDEAHQLEDVATQYFGVLGQQLPARGARARCRPRHGSARQRGRRRRRAAAGRMTRVRRSGRGCSSARCALAQRPPRPRRRGAAGSEDRVRVTAADARARAGDRAHGVLDALDGARGGRSRSSTRAARGRARHRPARGRDPRRAAVPAAGQRPRLRLLPRDARPRRVPARVAHRRVVASCATCCSIGSRPRC